jgi:hypothetical protein
MVASVEAIVIPVGIGDFIRHDFLLVNVVVEVVVEVEVAANSFLALVERPRRKRPRQKALNKPTARSQAGSKVHVATRPICRA